METTQGEEVYLQPCDPLDGLQVSVELVVDNEVIDAQESNEEEAGTVPTCDSTSSQPREFVFPDVLSYKLPPGINLKELDPKDAVSVAELIRKYESAFSMGPLDLGKSSLIPH